MKHLWAPWRISYISAEKPAGCIFCPSQESDRERLILLRSEYSLLMLNRYPYTGGHLLAAPLRHTADPDELSETEWLDLVRMLRRARSILTTAAQPDGFNIGMNLGAPAGAGVEEHLHLHIVPRWSGDSNFMAVINDTRIIPEGLAEVYDRLLPLTAAGGE